MSEIIRDGHKMCRHKADFVREQVAIILDTNGKLSPNDVLQLRRFVFRDAIWHSLRNPDFSDGGGPAAKKSNI